MAELVRFSFDVKVFISEISCSVKFSGFFTALEYL